MTQEQPSPVEGNSDRVRFIGLTRSLIEMWALLGGLVLCALVLLTAYSATMNLLFNAPVPGDFELVEMGVAVAVAMFLPYCQLTYSNVTVDIFTTWAGPRTIAAMTLLAALIAVVFACMMIWRMTLGMLDYMEYQEYTAIIGIPLWVAFPPFLFSLVLLLVAAVITTAEALRDLRYGTVTVQTQSH